MKGLERIKKYQNTIVVVLLFAVAFYLYNLFGPSMGLSNTGVTNKDVGADLVALFAELQAVQLDETLFDSTLYRSLSDFSVELASQPTGRSNPFDVFGRD